jgi:hypothetical protein
VAYHCSLNATDPGVSTTLYDIVARPRQLSPFCDVAIQRRIHAGIAAVRGPVIGGGNVFF